MKDWNLLMQIKLLSNAFYKRSISHIKNSTWDESQRLLSVPDKVADYVKFLIAPSRLYLVCVFLELAKFGAQLRSPEAVLFVANLFEGILRWKSSFTSGSKETFPHSYWVVWWVWIRVETSQMQCVTGAKIWFEEFFCRMFSLWDMRFKTFLPKLAFLFKNTSVTVYFPKKTIPNDLMVNNLLCFL